VCDLCHAEGLVAMQRGLVFQQQVWDLQFELIIISSDMDDTEGDVIK
jgi:hypothetical protein